MTDKLITTTNVFGRNLNQYKYGKRIIINQGGSRCFAGDQLVITDHGSKPISEIQPGDVVQTPKGFKKVTETHKMANSKPAFKIILKNGQVIKCTEDHLFYFKGDWMSIKDILSLLHETDKKL